MVSDPLVVVTCDSHEGCNGRVEIPLDTSWRPWRVLVRQGLADNHWHVGANGRTFCPECGGDRRRAQQLDGWGDEVR